MQSIAYLILIIFLWGMIWVIPATLAGKRRKNGRSVYWGLLVAALITEILIAVMILQLGVSFEAGNLTLLIGPIIGSTVGSYYYWKLASQKDKEKQPS